VITAKAVDATAAPVATPRAKSPWRTEPARRRAEDFAAHSVEAGAEDGEGSGDEP
jgi:hypothetical protein